MLVVSLNESIVCITEDFSTENLREVFELINGLKINPPDRTTLTLSLQNISEANKLEAFLSEYINLPRNFLNVRNGYSYITQKLGLIKFKINGTN